METVFRVDVIKRGLKCGLSVWAAGGKGNVGQQCSVMNLLILKKKKTGLFMGYEWKTVLP